MSLLDLELKRKLENDNLTSLGSSFDKDISLLAYVDDVMIITKDSSNNAVIILEVLSKFNSWTWLQTNINKSHVMFT